MNNKICTREEAIESAHAFIAGHFQYDGKRRKPHCCIPAEDSDDDIRLVRYLENSTVLPQQDSLRLKALEAAAKKFIAKVESGQARSKVTYAEFKAALAIK